MIGREPVGRQAMATRIEGVLFDFGGTLFHHEHPTELLVREAAKLGVELSRTDAQVVWDEIDAAAMSPEELAVGRDLDATLWAERWRVLHQPADRIVAGLGVALADVLDDPATWSPFASTAAVLGCLHEAGVPVGVLSNTGWDVRQPLVRHGLDRFVDAWILSYEVKVAKPDPAVFALACDRLGTEPARTLMVGDNHVADGGAAAAGLTAFIVGRGTPVGGENGLDLVPALVGLGSL